MAEYGIGPNMKGKPLELGKWLIRRQGKDAALVGYGSSVNECLAAAEMLKDQGVEVTVCDARFCKRLDTAMVRIVPVVALAFGARLRLRSGCVRRLASPGRHLPADIVMIVCKKCSTCQQWCTTCGCTAPVVTQSYL